MIVNRMPEAEYHARTELSSTGARLLLDSPARFHYAQSHPRKPKDAFDLGSAIHSKVLGTGYDVAILDFDDWRTKAAQTARDEARAAGAIPMLRKDSAGINGPAEAVLANPPARELFEQQGAAESSVFATDTETGVDMRARFDFLPAVGIPNPRAVDLKTTGTRASSDAFARTAAEYGYDVQEAHYTHTYRMSTGEEIPMLFVVVETFAPYLVAVHQLDTEFRNIGKQRAQRARELYAECSASGVWPGYGNDITEVMPPMWHVYANQDEMDEMSY